MDIVLYDIAQHILWNNTVCFFVGSYTEMNNPTHQTSDDSLENDDPEGIYITMNPTEYIPPPKDYKPKKKQSLNSKINS